VRRRRGHGELEALRERSPRHARVRQRLGLLLPRADAADHGGAAPAPSDRRWRGGGGGEDLAELVALEDKAEVSHALVNHLLSEDLLALVFVVRGLRSVLRRGGGTGERALLEVLAQYGIEESLTRDSPLGAGKPDELVVWHHACEVDGGADGGCLLVAVKCGGIVLLFYGSWT